MSSSVENWLSIFLGDPEERGDTSIGAVAGAVGVQHFFFLHSPSALSLLEPGFLSTKTLPSFMGQAVVRVS